jgi:hypothetical protein
MKLLYIDFCAKTVNLTNSLIPALLRETADVVCYGPGFVGDEELRGGIARFAEKHGRFDFHVMTMFKFDLNENEIDWYNRYTYPAYPGNVVRSFVVDMKGFLAKSAVPRILFLTAFDTYALGEKYSRMMAELDGHVVIWAGGFSKPIEELTLFSSEPFAARYTSYGVTKFGRWHDIVAEHSRKFINLGHFLAESEFAWTALDGRRDKVLVPGQTYVRRQSARQKLAKKGMLARSGHLKYLLSAMDHAGLRPYTRSLLQSMYYQTYAESLRSTRYAYTEGSGYEHPIRKFFEIPALGTVLLCAPCAGFDRLGFSHRKNAVTVDIDSIGDAVEWLRKSPAQAQQIADAGRQLIWDRHSLHARAEQFARCLKSIAAGRFAGSHWQDGDFVVDEDPSASVHHLELTSSRAPT